MKLSLVVEKQIPPLFGGTCQHITDTSMSSSLKSQALDQLTTFTKTKIHSFRYLPCVRNNPYFPGFLPPVSINGSTSVI